VEALALVLGSVVLAGLAFLVENLSGSFRSRAELVAIPRVHSAGAHTTFSGGSQADEAFRRLRTTLLMQSRDDLRMILVTSAEPGEGKSTVVANLGRSLARFFGLPQSPGLSEVLQSNPDATALPAGTGVVDPTTLLASAAPCPRRARARGCSRAGDRAQQRQRPRAVPIPRPVRARFPHGARAGHAND
jgi:hypothetical protein